MMSPCAQDQGKQRLYQEPSSVYFVLKERKICVWKCVSMRRIMNSVHSMRFAKDEFLYLRIKFIPIWSFHLVSPTH